MHLIGQPKHEYERKVIQVSCTNVCYFRIYGIICAFKKIIFTKTPNLCINKNVPLNSNRFHAQVFVILESMG